MSDSEEELNKILPAESNVLITVRVDGYGNLQGRTSTFQLQTYKVGQDESAWQSVSDGFMRKMALNVSGRRYGRRDVETSECSQACLNASEKWVRNHARDAKNRVDQGSTTAHTMQGSESPGGVNPGTGDKSARVWSDAMEFFKKLMAAVKHYSSIKGEEVLPYVWSKFQKRNYTMGALQGKVRPAL